MGSLIENVDIDIDRILTAFHALQTRVEYVVVEGTGGWMVPIRADYFTSDLAVVMRLPVLAVASNRLGCLNHAILTVQSIFGHGLPCSGLVLNNAEKTAT